MIAGQIIELISAGANIFSKERALYYINKGQKIQRKIEQIADADFYDKDMNKKALLEREIDRETNKLRIEFLTEAKK